MLLRMAIFFLYPFISQVVDELSHYAATTEVIVIEHFDLFSPIFALQSQALGSRIVMEATSGQSRPGNNNGNEAVTPQWFHNQLFTTGNNLIS